MFLKTVVFNHVFLESRLGPALNITRCKQHLFITCLRSTVDEICPVCALLSVGLVFLLSSAQFINKVSVCWSRRESNECSSVIRWAAVNLSCLPRAQGKLLLCKSAQVLRGWRSCDWSCCRNAKWTESQYYGVEREMGSAIYHCLSLASDKQFIREAWRRRETLHLEASPL